MDEYKIEKGIPLTKAGTDSGNSLVEIIKAMEIGDSFLANHPPTSFYAAARYAGFKVAVRRQKEGGFRVWRVK